MQDKPMLCKRTNQGPVPRLAGGGDHLGGVLQAGFRHTGSREHAGHFVGTGALIEEANLGFGASCRLALVDEEVVIGKGGDLR